MSIYSFENQAEIEFKAKFKFQPLSSSWVAIHPEPKGIIQFIGGALFGSFPTIFYHHFLNKLFQSGYTIIAFPFRFTFNHWSVSLQLLREQYVLRQEIIKKVINLNYNPQIYLEDKNYQWIGHSLGCKYIILLELLSGFEEANTNSFDWEIVWQKIKPNLPDIDGQETKKIVQQLENIKDRVKDIYDKWLTIRKEIENLVERSVDLKGLFIRSQPSLLVAPDISDTGSAIPIRQVADFLDLLELGAKPTRKQTQLLIENSSLFSITAILSFEKDMIAGNRQNSTGDSDAAWLINTLQLGTHRTFEIKNAFHLEPHWHQVGKLVIDFPGVLVVWSNGLTFAPLIPFSKPARAFFNEVRKPIIKTLTVRALLEQKVLQLLENLKY